MYYFARVLSVYMKSSVLDNYLSVIFAGTYREYLYYSLGLETIIALVRSCANRPSFKKNC